MKEALHIIKLNISNHKTLLISLILQQFNDRQTAKIIARFQRNSIQIITKRHKTLRAGFFFIKFLNKLLVQLKLCDIQGNCNILQFK